MPRRCQITGKRSTRARSISHAHNVTNRFQSPNLQRKRLYVPELKRFVRLKISARALRSITKLGLLQYLHSRGMSLRDVT